MQLMAILPTVFWCLWVFALGLMVGSFLNVVVARLPYEKSLVWPSSRCFACYTRIRFTDNVPILGYLRLGGKCRACGAAFSSRYLWVELGTGLAFLALFLAEVVFNVHGIPGVTFDPLRDAIPPLPALALWAYHAVLLSGLIAAALIDAEHRIIPTQITYTVMAVGVIGGALMPWPWPQPAVVGFVPAPANLGPNAPWALPEFAGRVPVGVQTWPFWGPTFDFAPPGTWKMGLLTSLLGALAGSLVVRLTKWFFETGFGREALGLGDADLLMMAGAFLGWQIPVLALFVGAVAALVLHVVRTLLFRGASSTPPPDGPAGTPVSGPPDARELPFGPGLAIGVVVTWFAWPWIGPGLQFPYFDGTAMVILCGFMGVGLLAAALFMRRPAEVEPAKA